MKVARIRLASDKKYGPYNDPEKHRIFDISQHVLYDGDSTKDDFSQFGYEFGVSPESYSNGYSQVDANFQRIMERVNAEWMTDSKGHLLKLKPHQKFAFRMGAYDQAIKGKNNPVKAVLQGGIKMGRPYKIDIFDVPDNAIDAFDDSQVVINTKKLKTNKKSKK